MLEEVNSMQGRDSPSVQLQLEEISSALSDDQIFQLCDPDYLQETLHDSEVTSCSNFCLDITTSNHHSLPKDHDHADIYSDGTGGGTTATSSTTTTTATTTNTTSNPSIISDPGQEEIENDISASINFCPSPPFSIYSNSAPQHEAALTNFINSGGLTHSYPTRDSVATLVGPTFQPVFEDGIVAAMPPGPYMPLSPFSPSSCSFLGTGIIGSTPYLATNANVALLADGSRMLMGSLLLNKDLQTQELDYQGDNRGIYLPDSGSNIFKPNNIQPFCNETRGLVNGLESGSPPLATKISSLEDSTFKVGKLSVEQRKEKIRRYMKKRNERNFSKKIKYACRKTLADSRPRVRGRFAKNDDFGESHNRLHACSSHEEDDKDEVDVKEENDMIDSSDIFAHISGVNSFKCNYSIQSWI